MESVRIPRRFACLALSCCSLLSLGLGACGDDNPDPYQPLTPACDACLLDETSRGCGAQYQSCAKLGDCENVVLCELYQQCYVRSSSSDCSSSRGCESGAMSEELELAQGFEDCARSTCSKICSFVE